MKKTLWDFHFLKRIKNFYGILKIAGRARAQTQTKVSIRYALTGKYDGNVCLGKDVVSSGKSSEEEWGGDMGRTGEEKRGGVGRSRGQERGGVARKGGEE